jgi:hypothetical protein
MFDFFHIDNLRYRGREVENVLANHGRLEDGLRDKQHKVTQTATNYGKPTQTQAIIMPYKRHEQPGNQHPQQSHVFL